MVVLNKKIEKEKPLKQVKFPSYFLQKTGRAFLQTIFQPDTKIRWKKQALRLTDEIFKNNDIRAIFATAPPFTDFLIARELAKTYNVPFIVDYRDAWVDNPFHFYATPFHKVYAINLEKEILTHADKIIVTTRHLKENILRRYKFLSQKIRYYFYDMTRSLYFDEKIYPNHINLLLPFCVFQDDRTPDTFLKHLLIFLTEKCAKEYSSENNWKSNEKRAYKID
jgi:glycosyltransferase involved in cell wall biosynthesis